AGLQCAIGWNDPAGRMQAMVGQISAQVEPRIGVIGLGYVGLPLAVAFGRQLPVVGYDIDSHRVAQLRQGHDHTRETADEELAAAQQLRFADNPAELAACNVYIVTVPTPIDA